MERERERAWVNCARVIAIQLVCECVGIRNKKSERERERGKEKEREREREWAIMCEEDERKPDEGSLI